MVAFVMGLPEWTGLRTESAFIEVASSFDEYVDKLQIDLECIFDHLEHDVTELSHITAIEELLDTGMPDWRNNSQLVTNIQAARGRLTGGTTACE